MGRVKWKSNTKRKQKNGITEPALQGHSSHRDISYSFLIMFVVKRVCFSTVKISEINKYPWV